MARPLVGLLLVLFAAGPAVATPELARRPQVAPGPDPTVVRYRPPVDAPVVDVFRPPSTPYGPGNRGWEYATVPGTPVVAAADGTVSFAGPVGGTMAVTVVHADGLRTSLTHLADVLVRAGATVAAGDVVGRAGDRMHFGVRRGEVYLDPAELLGPPPTGPVAPAGPPVVRLRPVRR